MAGLRELGQNLNKGDHERVEQRRALEVMDTAKEWGTVFSKLTVLFHYEDPASAGHLPRVEGTTVDQATRVQALRNAAGTIPSGTNADLDHARALATFFAKSVGLKTELANPNT